MRKKLLCGNWKMNFGPTEARTFFETAKFKPKLAASMRIYVPYLSLTAAREGSQETGIEIAIGAQNFHFEKAGAFTGEISIGMLKEIGIGHGLVGHSERRQYFQETNESVLKKAEAATQHHFETLICIGETLDQRNAGATHSTLTAQLTPLLKSTALSPHWGHTIQLAYEPVWAIGTGVVATPSQAEDAHQFIRSLISTHCGLDTAQRTSILYGGSVQPQNFTELMACPNIDGGLVGGASLKLDQWQALWQVIQ